MDVSVKAVHLSQVLYHFYQTFHRVVWIAYYSRAEEEALDVIPAIEFYRQVHEFRDGERGSRQVVAPAIDAIGTIVDTVVREHDFQ